ncbi:MAG: FAD binding domain-containing protein [Myxococcales bacterium]|nr:FAD binding domain-containing protein [Myxococcales bacterium]
MIRLPTSAEEARASAGTYRAGGTDLTELRQRGLSEGDVVDLRDVADLSSWQELPDGGWYVGARVTVQEVAEHAPLGARCRGLTQAYGGLATPQIRARATVGGSLVQQVRCWYYRDPSFHCLKKGGGVCYARMGEAPFHSVFDLGPCIAPHPSTPMLALLAYDGSIDVDGQLRPVPAVLGDGSDPRAANTLAPGELIRGVVVPAPPTGERSAYVRTIHRARAEWPLVEAIARVRLAADGAIEGLVIAAGGIANRPLRFDDVAATCVGMHPDDPALDEQLARVVDGVGSIPQTTWKAPLVPATLADAIRRACA